MDIFTALLSRIFTVLMAALSALSLFKSPELVTVDTAPVEGNTNYTYVYVNGFCGWGEYDKGDEVFSYWGLSTGNMMPSFRQAGYKTVSASLDAFGSVWDRACELYAQLSGTKVDYGEAHSKQYGHARYGKDYKGKALVENWSAENKVNLIGHSLGGPTCNMLASVLEYGAEAEIAATKDGSISPYFTGGKGNYVYSITGVASAYNGTTMMINRNELALALKTLKRNIEWGYPDTYKLINPMVDLMGKTIDKLYEKQVTDPDTAIWDMTPDNAADLNKTIKTVDSIYYFSNPCCSTVTVWDDTYQVPDDASSDRAFRAGAFILGRTNIVTERGTVLDETWQPNDGLVNTISEYAPFGEARVDFENPPSTAYTSFEKGVYNVFPTYHGSHMSLLGNIRSENYDGYSYFPNLMNMINGL